MAYANGQIPAAALVKISSGHLLRADAAAGFEAMSKAFRARFGYALGVSDGYRPLTGISTSAFSYPHAYSQVGIFENRYPSLVSLGVPDRRGPYKGKYWWRRPGTAAAAVPGTSNHGWGVALDLASNVNRLNSVENLWVRANSTRFGWVWPSWAQKFPSLEPWHYEFVGTVSFPVGGGTGSITTPTIPGAPAPITPEDDMSAEAERKIDAIYAAIFEGGSSMPGGRPMKDQNEFNFKGLRALIADLPKAPTAKAVADEVWTRQVSLANGQKLTVGAALQAIARGVGGTDASAIADAIVASAGTKLAREILDGLAARLKD
ncbi:M15 family metallopeptidase [Oerskovia enterophila]|uniref:M15 family metallopeptidase n=1 Tax=Oerskovia enterophila TaxID=43678 RepID=UPI00382493B1